MMLSAQASILRRLGDLCGQAFAENMVAIEPRFGPGYDAAWCWLGMTREERQARLRALRTGT